MKKHIKLLIVALITLFLLQCKKTDNSSTLNEDSSKITQGMSSKKDTHKHEGEDDSQYVSQEVQVIGDVINPLTIMVDSLKKMEVKELKDVKIVCQSGLTKENIHSTKGVLLKDILEKSKIAQQEHKDRNFYIVARAADEYKATFSWAELFNNPTGDQVYVLFEQNGQPLKEKGEMILVSLSDTKTGPRHVKWLTTIEVKRIE